MNTKQLSLNDIRTVLIESKNIISSYPIPINTKRIELCIKLIEDGLIDLKQDDVSSLSALSMVNNLLNDQYLENIIREELGSKDVFDIKILRNLVLAVFIKLNGEINE